MMNKSWHFNKMDDYVATYSNVFKEYITPKIMLYIMSYEKHYQGRWVGGWGTWVMGIKEGM